MPRTAEVKITKKKAIEANEFLIYLSRKRWFLDYIDVFKLIAIYDLLYPQRTLKDNNLEANLIKMIAEISYYIKKGGDTAIKRKDTYSVYFDLIKPAIIENGSLTKSDVNNLIWDKFPDSMTKEQKETKIHNILANLRKNNKIQNTGTTRNSRWILAY